ncbi:Intraflagellar transport protein IFT122 [Giardia muris]|uniref:Intraflagellar transport protein IFT122 n=1 Tax=Giardia muris TaxID=5742 RepID=A0A4Z1SM48_GIAMU|nr:Intraflagellar transport protein IFT122 [Giardia muris]|eukprot:TNJ26630.1 Intraflagellar transport protein IFT122 [Giardia muris]
MQAEPLWSVTVGRDPVYRLACSQDRGRVCVAAGRSIVLLGPGGELTRQIQTPHPEIFGLAVAPDGQRIATAGADGLVVFFDATGAALFKFTHATEVQCCAWSPNGQWFLSAAATDYGLFSLEDNATKVAKYPLRAPARAAAWAPDSQWFALALDDGCVGLFTTTGVEFGSFYVGAPTWALHILPVDVFTDTRTLHVRPGHGRDDDDDDEDEFIISDMPSGDGLNGGASQYMKSVIHQSAVDLARLAATRIVLVSWDLAYLVADPSVAVTTPGAKAGRKGGQGADPILLSTRLPFIPLCFDIQGNLAFVSGVGATVLVLDLRSGRILVSLFRARKQAEKGEANPQTHQNAPVACSLGAVRSEENTRGLSRKEKEERAEDDDDRTELDGLDPLWCYGVLRVEPSRLLLALSDGSVVCLGLEYGMCHALHGAFYAYRSGLTRVHALNLRTGTHSTLDVGVSVEHIALSDTRLAIATPGRLLLFARAEDPARGLCEPSDRELLERVPERYVLAEELPWRRSCGLLYLASEHVITCASDAVCAYNFSGQRTDSWHFRRARVTHATYIGGVPGQEGLLVGLSNGTVTLVRLGTRFVAELANHGHAIRALELSPDRQHLLALDVRGVAFVHRFFDPSIILGEPDLPNGAEIQALGTTESTGKPLHVFHGIVHAVWNQRLPNVLVLSTARAVDLCVGAVTVHTFQLPEPGSFAIAQHGRFTYLFRNRHVGHSLVDIAPTDFLEQREIPITPIVTHYTHSVLQELAAGVTGDVHSRLDSAIAVASLGVPTTTWRDLAIVCLLAGEVELAQEALATVGDARGLKAVAEVRRRHPGAAVMLAALALGMCHHFAEAALLFAALGNADAAAELLLFVRRDPEPGGDRHDSSSISAVACKLIRECASTHVLADLAQAGGVLGRTNAIFVPLGCRGVQKTSKPENVGLPSQGSRLTRILDDVPTNPSDVEGMGREGDSQGQGLYSYLSDYRIILRKQLAALARTDEERHTLLLRHARFLEEGREWQAAAASYLDAKDPERAVDVLIASGQTAALLRLVHALPPVSRPGAEGGFDDFRAVEAGPAPGTPQAESLKRAYEHVLAHCQRLGETELVLFVAQRLGEPRALLRVLASQGRWEQAEELAIAYPELRASVNEARASALLQEGRFMEALQRLRLAGNAGREASLIRRLLEAAVAERKFDLARALLAQLSRQLLQAARTGAPRLGAVERCAALKAARARILAYTGLKRVREYLQGVLHCPDPYNPALICVPAGGETGSTAMISAGVFLTGYASLPRELACADLPLLASLDAGEGEGEGEGEGGLLRDELATAGSARPLIDSSTTPQVGLLACIDLDTQATSLPAGIPELAVWICLALASGGGADRDTEERALRRLLQARLPGGLQGHFRRRALLARGERGNAPAQQGRAVDACVRCGARFPALPGPTPAHPQQTAVLAGLPHCCPVYSDICRTCGLPAVRSALSLEILPLISVEPDDETTMTEALERASAVQIDVDFLLSDAGRLGPEGGHKGSLGKLGPSTHDEILDVLRQEPVAGDGRGVVLSKDALEAISPRDIYVLDDPWTEAALLPHLAVGGVVKRLFVRVADKDVQHCQACGLFFSGLEFEEYFVVARRCPICGFDGVVL